MRQENIVDFLQEALQLGSQGLGVTLSNPSVGCVVVGEGGSIVGKARTSNQGRPHAEYNALEQAGDYAKGADVFVTLEPCSHKGESGACTERLIKADVARVYILCKDVDHRVRGSGIATLKASGIEVIELWKQEWANKIVQDAMRMIAGYALNRTKNRTLVTMKVATSLDGKMGIKDQGRVWITGEEARLDAHWLRGRYDAILIGRGTLMLDNPKLNSRISGEEWRSPIPVVIDPQAKITQENYHLLHSNLLMLVDQKIHDNRAKILESYGVEAIRLTSEKGRFRWKDILSELANRGITRLLVEGGSDVYQGLIKEKYIDRIHWYRNSSIIGDEGINVFHDVGRLKGWQVLKRKTWGNDDMIILEDDRLNDTINMMWE